MRLLIIEDEAADAEIIADSLEGFGFAIEHCERVDTADALKQALDVSVWDAIICDYVLPSLDWQTALTRSREKDPEVPFLVVSGKRGEEYAVEVMREGAQDYITKQRLFRLGPALQREIEIAEQKKAEAQRQRLMEAELKRARRLESTGKLAGGLSHNLNNVLLSIIGNLELAIADEDLLKARGLMRRALFSCVQATRVVRQLNNLTAEPVLTPEAIDLNLLAENLGVMLAPVIPDRIQLVFESSKTFNPVVIDVLALEQTVINLILNARDAISDEGQIQCLFESTDDEICFSIIDDGEGIAPDHLERVFEPYFSTKASLGTGMGLTSVDQLVKAMAGHITVQSSLGNGTRFDLTLPNLGNAATTNSPVARVSQGKALIVHSKDRIRLKLYSVLYRQGFECVCYANSNEITMPPNSVDLALVECVVNEYGRADPVVEPTEKLADQLVCIVNDPLYAADDLPFIDLDETTPIYELENMIQRLIPVALS